MRLRRRDITWCFNQPHATVVVLIRRSLPVNPGTEHYDTCLQGMLHEFEAKSLFPDDIRCIPGIPCSPLCAHKNNSLNRVVAKR